MRLWLVIVFLLSTLCFTHTSYAAPRMQGIPILPPCPPDDEAVPYICEVGHTWDLAELEAHSGEDFWLEDDVFVFARSFNGNGIAILGDISTALRPVPDSDWFALAVRIPQYEEAILSWSYLPIVGSDFVWDAVENFEWRGPQSPEEPGAVETLSGELVEHTFDSEFLAAERDITVYLPPDYDENLQYPVVYMTDGAVVRRWAPFVEAAIKDGVTGPVILVGIHAHPPSTGNNRRAEEYLPLVGSPRFNMHLQFVLEEVLPWTEANFAVADRRDGRAIFGLSDGASLAVWIGQHQSDIFGSVMAFSLGSNFEFEERETPPAYFLVAGTLETHFYMATTRWQEILERHEVPVVLIERVAGHNSQMWLETFPEALAWFTAEQD